MATKQIHKQILLSADHEIFFDAIDKEKDAKCAQLNVVAIEDGIDRDLKLVAQERDLSRSDLDVKGKEVKDLEERIQSLEQALSHTLKEREVSDAKCGKLEEKLQSVMFEKDLLKRYREDDKILADKLVEEVKEMKSQKNVDLQILKAENKVYASKITALEEKCRLLEDQLEKKVEELNEEVESMTRMAAAKNSADQRNAECEIEISSLQAEISDLQSARKILEDAHCSCIQNITAVHREKDLRAEEAVALRMQLDDSMKTKHIMEQRLEVIQKKLKYQIKKNERKEKDINSLMVEKASREKLFKILQQDHEDTVKKLKTLNDTSDQFFAMFKNMMAELMDKSRTHEIKSTVKLEQK